MKNNPLEIPYRLETIEDVTNAKNGDLFGITDYKRLVHFAQEKTIQQPPALLKSKKKVTKDFMIFVEEKIRDVKIDFTEVADLPLIAQYELIEESIPWIDDIIRHETIFHFFHSFPLEIRKRFLLEHLPDVPSSMFSAVLAIRKLLRKDLVVYIKAQKTSTLSLVEFKKSLVALTVFDSRNEDILDALKTEKTDENRALHQNAMAEILFARLPNMIQGLLIKNPNIMVQKLSLKMSRLNLSSRNIISLMGYINKKNLTFDNLHKALNKIDGMAQKISIPQESQNKLHDYIEAMKKNMDRAPSVYRTLFLKPELETYKKLYRPTKVIKPETIVIKTVTERTVGKYMQLSTLDFYATKDFFDLLKAKYSKDCTDTYQGEHQLMTPYFFNIRIFKGKKWVGNIYMLDFCEEHSSLVIDRIQIPRHREASYHQFFDYLKEVLIEMFEGVHYEYILMPLKISNHDRIQNIFHQYKKKLSKKEKLFFSPWARHFESLGTNKRFYVLHERSQA